MIGTPLIEIDKSLSLDALLQQVLNRALVAINAKSGSLMLVDHEREILEIKARLGVPISTRRTEPVFAIGDSSIAGLVARTGKPYLCTDAEHDKHFAYSRSGKLTFQSLVSVPIVADDVVVAVINADDKTTGRFTEADVRTLEAVAKEVATPIADRVKRLDILDGLHEVGVELTRLTTEAGVEHVLDRIARAAVNSLGVDLVTLYQYDQEQDHFLVEGRGPTIGGRLREPGPMQTKVHEEDVPWIVVHHDRSGFYPDVHAENYLTKDIPREDNRNRFIEREGICSMAALLLLIRSPQDTTQEQEIVGVMFANYRSPHEFTGDERKALYTFADYAAVAIQNARMEDRRAREQIAFTASIAASFAHRMKNMAGTIPIAVQLLRECIPEEDEFAQEQLDSIESDTRMLLNLAERLARPFREGGGLGPPGNVDVNRLVSKVLTRAQAHFQGVRAQLDLDPQLPGIPSVELQLEEVFDNIIVNACEAMERQAVKHLTICTRSIEGAGRVEVEITDTGPGIPQDMRGKLFTPGVSTKEGKGMGLGLWWCRTFMRATGGDVLLTDAPPDQGASFTVQLSTVARGSRPG
jgi:signal transduction histidine kinase